MENFIEFAQKNIKDDIRKVAYILLNADLEELKSYIHTAITDLSHPHREICLKLSRCMIDISYRKIQF